MFNPEKFNPEGFLPEKKGEEKGKIELEEIPKSESLLLHKGSVEKPELERQPETKEAVEHEKYHSVESEFRRHGRKFDHKFMDLEWQLHLEALGEDYDAMNRRVGKSSVIPPKEAFDFVHEQRMKAEKDFFNSLRNPKEQEARKEAREELVKQLESIYDSLDKKLFTAESQETRKKELSRALEEKDISGRDKEVQDILDSLYHRYFSEKIIDSKDRFIEDALVEFDPLIFKEAQKRVLGKAKETNYEQAFEDKFKEIEQRKIEEGEKKKEKRPKEIREELRRHREKKT